MNKIKIGNYLRSLREATMNTNNKHMTREDLCQIFSNLYDKELSITAISEWESGKSLPSLENIEILSRIYGKSIDEILDGEDSNSDSFSKTYFIANPNWTSYPENFSDNLYTQHQNQIIKVRTRFKELLLKYITDEFTNNERQEIFFLFSHFYYLSDYAYIITDSKEQNKNDVFMKALNVTKYRFSNSTPEEVFWEIQKLFSERENIQFSFKREVPWLKTNQYYQARFKTLESWQKDLLLAEFQFNEPCHWNPNKYGPVYSEINEKEHGGFDKEELIKQDIKALIQEGACINHNYFNSKLSTVTKQRIIDRVEELYNYAIKPLRIKVYYSAKSEAQILSVENNKKNRFIKLFYEKLLPTQLPIFIAKDSYKNIDEFYSWFSNADSLSEEVYLKIAQEAHIDVSKDSKKRIADVNAIFHLDEILKTYNMEEQKIQQARDEFYQLYAQLKNGEKYRENISVSNLFNDEKSFIAFIKAGNEKLSFSDYQYGRDFELTKELLENLPRLTLCEIRNKYLKMEVIEK